TVAENREIIEKLPARIVGIGTEGAVKARPEFGLVELEIGGGQLVLGRKASVEAGFGDPGVGHDLIDADGADALRIEKLASRFEDAVSGAGAFGGLGGLVRHQDGLTMLPIGT